MPDFETGSRARRGRVRARSRGTATVEAAIALPVMIIVFAGALFVRDKYLGVADVEAKARTCAWLYSAMNCPQSARPAGCEGVLTPGNTPAAHSPDVDDALNRASGELASGQDERGVIDSVVSSMIKPVLSQVFGEYAQATTSGTVPRPALYGGGQISVGGNYHLACNVAPQTPSDVVKQAWDHLTD